MSPVYPSTGPVNQRLASKTVNTELPNPRRVGNLLPTMSLSNNPLSVNEKQTVGNKLPALRLPDNLLPVNEKQTVGNKLPTLRPIPYGASFITHHFVQLISVPNCCRNNFI